MRFDLHRHPLDSAGEQSHGYFLRPCRLTEWLSSAVAWLAEDGAEVHVHVLRVQITDTPGERDYKSVVQEEARENRSRMDI